MTQKKEEIGENDTRDDRKKGKDERDKIERDTLMTLCDNI